jgi:UDP-3-O-[3-hydroxymyristoyl] glucosamine N-acyltransferase
MIVMRKVPVKLPESGIGAEVGEEVVMGKAVEVAIGVVIGVGVGVDPGERVGEGDVVADGVDSKAGPSAAA